ncbi:DUF6708 domain-containing protein [Lysobacter soli]|uniref:DUF6708 domain-containing protein n=1 Tax=Lysobacter soli TaxID=453783 RepID=UPI00240EF043|nr:hypothetical protein [Lysobacter soli]MDG2516762.1 hypothetical protein [Lysobacter soli]
MSKPRKIRRLMGIRFGGKPLPHGYSTGMAPQPDGVRRINNQCVEIECFRNASLAISAPFIGCAISFGIAFFGAMVAILPGPIDLDETLSFLFASSLPFLFAVALYFLEGAHRSRGTFIRVHRGTRQVYYVANRRKRLQVFEWDKIEAMAGFIPAPSAGGGYAQFNPLYLIGVDYTMNPPTEVCMMCNNGGGNDARSAMPLWEYLQLFMAFGPDGLPPPAPIPPRLSRRDTAWKPLRDWWSEKRTGLRAPVGRWLLPLKLPLWGIGLMFWYLPNCLGEYLQYNVPYTAFPKENDELCGFAEPTPKRKPVIRVNGEIIDP